jgi:hypothetical protein
MCWPPAIAQWASLAGDDFFNSLRTNRTAGDVESRRHRTAVIHIKDVSADYVNRALIGQAVCSDARTA